MSRPLLVGILILAVSAGCQSRSARSLGLNSMTPEVEALAGTRRAPVLEAHHGGVIRNTEAERRMERIGRRLCAYTSRIQM